MITGNAESKNPSNGEYADIRKYIGVGSVNVLAINPDNARLRSYGWTIPEDAEEPKYVTTDSSGRKSARVRFLVQIQDLDEKPVVAMDFWIRPDISFTADNSKCKLIDSFGRTAYGTKEEVKAHRIPQYANGPASIASDYKPCHVGEEEIVLFTMKYLNVTPLQIFDRKTQGWVSSKNPGRLTIDHWDRLCNGDVSELKQYFALQPDNRVKVVFGIRTTDENKTYQTFMSNVFIGNGATPDRNSGEYTTARKAIDRAIDYANEHNKDYPYSFSALPVKEWKETATEVKENPAEDMPDFNSPEYHNGKDDLEEVFGPSF